MNDGKYHVTGPEIDFMAQVRNNTIMVLFTNGGLPPAVRRAIKHKADNVADVAFAELRRRWNVEITLVEEQE
jgi:hypothetical protein